MTRTCPGVSSNGYLTSIPVLDTSRTSGFYASQTTRIWKVAKAQNLAIVSKDDDFRQRALLFGAPPKTIWVRLGNAPTDEIERELRKQADIVRAFLSGADEAILILRAPIV